VLWAAQRPVNCTGFAVTTDVRGRARAVLGDLRTIDDSRAASTATTYDLKTGEAVWGPVEVPGPHRGPGLVFAAPPEEPGGETGPGVALDPTAGRVAAIESGPDGLRVLGEYHGVVLLTRPDALAARDTTDDRELWRISLAEHGWTAASISASRRAAPGDGFALLATSDSTGALIDLHGGVVVDPTARDAGVDPTTGRSVILDDAGLHAFDPAGRPLWSLSVDDETTPSPRSVASWSTCE